MTRKRNLKAKAVAAATADLKSASVDIKEASLSAHAVDSGNESPPTNSTEGWKEHILAFHRLESIKAWVSILVLAD